MLQNIVVAGAARSPAAQGIDLEEKTVIEVEAEHGKVMKTLQALEEGYPGAGSALLPLFFPGELWPEERTFWSTKRSELEEKKHKRVAGKTGIP